MEGGLENKDLRVNVGRTKITWTKIVSKGQAEDSV